MHLLYFQKYIQHFTNVLSPILQTFQKIFDTAKLQSTKLKADIEQLEGLEHLESNENISLRRDKVMLSDEVAQLHDKVPSLLSNYL